MNRGLEEQIQAFGQEHTILTGICDASPFEEVRPALSGKQIPFAETNIQKRIDPRLTMPDCQSILVIGVNYHKRYTKEPDLSVERGCLSMLAAGLDYHVLVKGLLQELINTLLTSAHFTYQIYCDTGPLVDRAVGRRAGLGFIGKSNALISRAFGPLFSIGYALTDLPLTPTIPLNQDNTACGSCDYCIQACPTGALSRNGFDYQSCISYLTQAKEDIPVGLRVKIGQSLYGCDRCTLVCPWARKTPFEPVTDVEALTPGLDNLLALSNRAFQEVYKTSALFWRGRKVIRRNAIIAKENGRQNGLLEHKGAAGQRF